MVGLKVKIAATVAFLATIVTAVQYLIDDKPETAPDWTAILTTGSLAFGMWFSRQNDTSSEAVRATGTTVK
jgi:uncharacterized membrane protein